MDSNYQLYILTINCISFIVNLLLMLMHHKNEGKIKKHITEMLGILTNPIDMSRGVNVTSEPINEYVVQPTPSSINEYIRPSNGLIRTV